MLHIDICCCTYNSSKWLEGFFYALSHVDYDPKYIHLYITDNNSTDNTIASLKDFKTSLKNTFADFEIIQTGYNAGFGIGSNTSARKGKSEYILFLNVDTEIFPDAFTELEKVVQSVDDSIGAFEMRQIPYEHPKYYDPVTMETTWATGAAMVVKREVFDKLNGFDETIFMYCEDVDFSWRIRLAGYKIIYVPTCVVRHHLDLNDEMKPTQIAGQLAGEKILRLKFADDNELRKWPEILRKFQPILEKDAFASELSKRLLSDVKKNEKNYRRFYETNIKNSTFSPIFEGCYEFAKDGQSYHISKPKTIADITVIVRDYNNSKLLTSTLTSLCNQTEKDFKVLISSSNENKVVNSIINKFAENLNIECISGTNSNKLSALGNAALKNISTKYAVFLNEGDYFFPDYIELISKLIEENSDCKMFCSSSIVATTKSLDKDSPEYAFISKQNITIEKWSKLNFYMDNILPVQAVVFDISLFNEYGGFDESLKAFEDWDLWIKYSTYCKIASINKSLSVSCTPANLTEIIAHQKYLDSHHLEIYNKLTKYKSEFSAQEIHSIKWTPDIVPNYEGEDFDELKEIANQICNSTTFKIASPFRRTLYKISDKFADMAAFWGPKDLQENNQSYRNIQKFIIQTQDSSYMNILSFITNLIKQKK